MAIPRLSLGGGPHVAMAAAPLWTRPCRIPSVPQNLDGVQRDARSVTLGVR